MNRGINLKQAKLIDTILRNLSEKTPFDAITISQLVKITEEEAQFLLDVICYDLKFEGVDVVLYSGRRIPNSNIFWTEITSKYLLAGGCEVNYFNKQYEKQQADIQRQNREDLKLKQDHCCPLKTS